MSDLGTFALFAAIFGIPLLTVILPNSRKKKPPEPQMVTYKPKHSTHKSKITPAKQAPAKPTKPAKPSPSADTIKAMHIQADAERAIAEALQRRADREPDAVKRARIERQVANSWLRFNKILDQIDKLTPQL